MTLKEKQQSTHKQCDRRVFCTTAHSRASIYRMLRTLLHIYLIFIEYTAAKCASLWLNSLNQNFIQYNIQFPVLRWHQCDLNIFVGSPASAASKSHIQRIIGSFWSHRSQMLCCHSHSLHMIHIHQLINERRNEFKQSRH